MSNPTAGIADSRAYATREGCVAAQAAAFAARHAGPTGRGRVLSAALAAWREDVASRRQQAPAISMIWAGHWAREAGWPPRWRFIASGRTARSRKRDYWSRHGASFSR